MTADIGQQGRAMKQERLRIVAPSAAITILIYAALVTNPFSRIGWWCWLGVLMLAIPLLLTLLRQAEVVQVQVDLRYIDALIIGVAPALWIVGDILWWGAFPVWWNVGEVVVFGAVLVLLVVFVVRGWGAFKPHRQP